MKIFEEKGYTYKEHINSGGEGEIHLIKSVDKLFVAKIFPKMDKSTFALLGNLSRLQIPNIPQIHELFNYDDKTIIIRDYIEGETLYDYMKANGPLDYIEAKSITIKISNTLKSLHNLEPNPIIYRDLKPENIIVTPQKEIYLIDFGIARYYKQENTRDTILAGTKGYTAPEVLAGMQSDNRSDIYSVGLLFYELLTGKNLLEPPYQVRPVKESNASLDKHLDTLIATATDFNQTNRYSSIEDFIYYLEHPRKTKSKKRIKGFLIAAACIVIFAAVCFGVFKLVLEPNIQEYIEFEPEPTSVPVEEETDAISSGYETKLHLDFDTESDYERVLGYPELDSRFSFFDGKLDVEDEVCQIDFRMQNGMTVHYKMTSSNMATVGLGAYNISSGSLFSCAFFNEQSSITYTAWDIKMQGQTIDADEYMVDVLLYTTADNSAMYAFIIDDEKEKIAYTAYKVPSTITDDLSLDMGNYKFSDTDFLYVESVDIIEGSLHEYIAQSFISYHKYKDEIDDFFETDIDDLPDIPLEENTD